MNPKAKKKIQHFLHLVSEYISEEYHPAYYKHITHDKNLSKIYNLVCRYYLGGNNVPDTAGMVVENIKNLPDVYPYIDTESDLYEELPPSDDMNYDE